MDVDAVRRQLIGTRFADVRFVPETGSTNDDLLRLSAEGAQDGTVLVAGHQTAGRGRLDRQWTAPPGSSLLCSVLLRPRLPQRDWHLLTTAMGVAASQAIDTVSSISVGLKWPNDLVVEDATATRKLAGILAEATTSTPAGPTVVVGIGVNVRWPAELPDDLSAIATALNHLTGDAPSIQEILVELLRAFDAWCRRVDLDPADPDGVAALLTAYRQRCSTLGRRVRVERAGGDGPLIGVATDVVPSGHLIVTDEDGTRVEVAVGDVVHLRETDRGHAG